MAFKICLLFFLSFLLYFKIDFNNKNNMRMSYPPTEGFASPEIEIAESGTMLDSKGKFNDLKAMLDSNKENIKMDAMRRIINMVARGKDVSELFPAIVKNVAAKNLELKKLVYVYLVRYAEEQQDLALLSISTFQRGLKDPNQLIRASALRVLSSIRVQMIAPVMMLAIKEAVRDMSPYVRKVAAHAIPKLFALDPELQSSLIECIDFLLGDKRTLVLGSAVYAFEQTCPDRLDLLHRHFRLLCRALADIDEWGQIVMIGLLTRYARTQFLSPFGNGRKWSLDESKGAEKEENDHHYPLQPPLDPDHNLLLSSVRPLLQSRNPAVVMAVAQLLYYIAPHSQLSVVPRALVRLLRGPNEVQYIILVNIASICVNTARQQQDREVFAISKNLFEPFLKSFFIRSSEPIHVKQLKLQVLTSLVTEANVQLVIRELQAYMQMNDLADSAIDAIGRCALQVPSAADSCLATLIRIISSNGTREQIICASVVVLKRLLHSDAPLPLLKRVFRLIDNVKAPMARACILWLIGIHIKKVPKLAPDLLRKVATTFCEEAECVKLQALNLAVRLWIIDPANREGKCALLVKYIFQLARYDRSYDIRDRCRFLRNFIFGFSSTNEKQQIDENGNEEEREQQQNGQPENTNDNGLVKFPLEIFLSERPAPVVQNTFADRAEHFQLGTLSHLLNQKCSGYTELPDFPVEQPDPTIRRSAYPLPSDSPKIKPQQKMDEDEEFTSFDEEEEDESEEDEDEEDGDEEDEEEEEEQKEEFDSADDGENSMEEEEEEEEEELKKPIKIENAEKLEEKKKQQKTEKKKLEDDLLLLDLDFGPPIMPSSSSSSIPTGIFSKWTRTPAQWVPDEFSLHLVQSVVSGGLIVDGRFCRSPCLFSNSMVCLELQISFRHSKIRSSDVQLNPNLPCNLLTSGPAILTGLNEGERRRVTLGIDFADSAQTSEWTIKWSNGEKMAQFQVQAPYGEQIESIELSSEIFLEKRTKLGGMNKVQKKITKAPDSFTARQLFELCNCKQIIGLKFCFAAQTISRKELVLISFLAVDDEENWCLQINCENIAFASIFAEELFNKLG